MANKRQDIARTISEIAKLQIDVKSLAFPKLESVAAELLAQHMRVTEVSRSLAKQADLLVSVLDRFDSLSTYAIQVKKLRQQLDASAFTEFAKALDSVHATKGTLVSTSTLSEATKALAEQYKWRIDVIDASALQQMAQQYVKAQEAFAGSLAFRIRGLDTTEFGRTTIETPASAEVRPSPDLHLPSDYDQLIVQSDWLPF
jgi:hypothetical protein